MIRFSAFATLLLAVSAAMAAPLESVDVGAVTVGGEMGRRIEVTVENNLLELDLDGDFLAPFQARTKTSGYIGLGKTIDAFVRMAAHTDDPRLLERKEHLVSETIALQEEDGYIGMFAPEARMWKLWDVHEMAYIIYGLAMDHRFFGNDAALKAAEKAADYIMTAWRGEPDRIPGGGEITKYMAITGIQNGLIALTRETGETTYRDFAGDFCGLRTWNGPIVLGRWGNIQGHVYAYLCRSLAQLRLHRDQPNAALVRPTQRAMDFMLKEDGLAITGACGQHECWHDSQAGIANLGETCATAYLIRWLDEQMRMQADPRLGDVMERATHNALFAAQSPDGRRLRYYVPTEGPRVYWDGDTYCCPCNYRRIVAELPGMIAYRGGGGLYVNLYTASTVETNVGETPVTLVQETDYPQDEAVRITVQPAEPAAFPLHLRIPAWCTDAAVTINGAGQPEETEAGAWTRIDRTWKRGDVVTLELPVTPRLVAGRKANVGRAAVMAGPLVFCLSRAQNPALEDSGLRAVTIDPDTLAGPEPDDTVHPGGWKCTVKAWRTTAWYPHGPHDWTLTLTESADPASEETFFHVPNPNDPALDPDPLVITE
ncbi:MAG: beta-L-arabinofuranosidase domain-containing protein [Candidatus Hydrogenedentota bacterium]